MIKLVDKNGSIKLTTPSGNGGFLKEVYWDDILEKPFGIVKYYDEVIHDCNITEETVKTNSVNYGGMELFLVKVGEIPTSAEDYIKRISSITINIGQVFGEEILNEGKTMIDGSYAVMVDGLPMVVAIDKDNATVNGYEYPEAGFYVIHGIQAGALMYVEKVAFEEVFPIDERLLPDNYFVLKDEVEQIKEDIEKYDSYGNQMFNIKNDITLLDESVKNASTRAVNNSVAITQLQNEINKLPPITSPIMDEGKMIVVRNGGFALEAIPNITEEVF